MRRLDGYERKGVKLENILNQAKYELARRHHLEFMCQCWQRVSTFKIGMHTKAICKELDVAIERYKKGESTYLVVKVPFRHGKTDLISRYFPAHYLGLFPDNEIMVATYSADFSNEISRFARELVRSDKYKKIFPKVKIDPKSHQIQNWKIENRQGVAHWSGIGGAQTGKGYQLGIIDDYLKNRKDAESQIIRDTQWDWFTNVFLTRKDNISITIILATPWHMDDLIGRIEEEKEKNPEFPQFRIVKFPAFSDKYEKGVLFPERFSAKWYKENKAALGPYDTASLMQCDPQPREGALFKTDKVKISDKLPQNILYARGWDLASTSKELVKHDPDYTVGIKAGIRWEKRAEVKEPIPHLFIEDIKRMQAEAPERERHMKQMSDIDGDAVPIIIESVAAYKDAAVRIRELLGGLRSVFALNVNKDKIVRATPLFSIFEAGNVTLKRSDWNNDFLAELAAFPSGKHDDQVDALSVVYEHLKRQRDKDDWNFSGVETERKSAVA